MNFLFAVIACLCGASVTDAVMHFIYDENHTGYIMNAEKSKQKPANRERKVHMKHYSGNTGKEHFNSPRADLVDSHFTVMKSLPNKYPSNSFDAGTKILITHTEPTLLQQKEVTNSNPKVTKDWIVRRNEEIRKCQTVGDTHHIEVPTPQSQGVVKERLILNDFAPIPSFYKRKEDNTHHFLINTIKMNDRRNSQMSEKKKMSLNNNLEIPIVYRSNKYKFGKKNATVQNPQIGNLISHSNHQTMKYILENPIETTNKKRNADKNYENNYVESNDDKASKFNRFSNDASGLLDINAAGKKYIMNRGIKSLASEEEPEMNNPPYIYKNKPEPVDDNRLVLNYLEKEPQDVSDVDRRVAVKSDDEKSTFKKNNSLRLLKNLMYYKGLNYV